MFLVTGILWCNVSYAGLIFGKENLPIVTKPEGAECNFKNNKGKWNVTTPGIVKLKISKDNLKVICKKDGYKTKELSLRARSKESLISNMADYEIGIVDTEELVIQGIFDAIISDPTNTILNIGALAIEGSIKVIGKVGKFIKEPVTYATHKISSEKLHSKKYHDTKSYNAKKFPKKGGWVPFIIIEMEEK